MTSTQVPKDVTCSSWTSWMTPLSFLLGAQKFRPGYPNSTHVVALCCVPVTEGYRCPWLTSTLGVPGRLHISYSRAPHTELMSSL